MANHFSALKRARQTVKRTARNRASTSQMRSALRFMRESLEKGDKAAAEQTYRQTVSALDRAIHGLAVQVPSVGPFERAEIVSGWLAALA